MCEEEVAGGKKGSKIKRGGSLCAEFLDPGNFFLDLWNCTDSLSSYPARRRALLVGGLVVVVVAVHRPAEESVKISECAEPPFPSSLTHSF